MSDRLYVDLGENSYNIIFQSSFNELSNELKEINAPKKLLIITDSNVNKLYADEVKNLLIDNGYDVNIYYFNAGEENKNMNTILEICNACLQHGLDRKSMIIALGGGVVGDMAGFAAAIYMRGIQFVQIPTTLLAQSDSSVGGKTGIDFSGSKNILGAFHQPKLVYINVNTLKTLPSKEFISGMGEVIKHGVMRDRDFFEYVKQNHENIKGLSSDILIKMAKTNCSIKANVVMNDEKESGLRAILNLGHTLGHAIESAFNFKMTHGECVGLGLMGVSYISYMRNILSDNELSEIRNILKLYNFPVGVKLPEHKIIIDFMKKDKKKSNNKLQFILPKKIGEVIQVTDISENEIYDALRYISE